MDSDTSSVKIARLKLLDRPMLASVVEFKCGVYWWCEGLV